MFWLDIPKVQELNTALGRVASGENLRNPNLEIYLATINIIVKPLVELINKYADIKKSDVSLLHTRKELLDEISSVTITILSDLDHLQTQQLDLSKLMEYLQKFKQSAENKAIYLQALEDFYQEYPSGTLAFRQIPRVALSPLTKIPTYRPTNDSLPEIFDVCHRQIGGLSIGGSQFDKWNYAIDNNETELDFFLWLEEKNSEWLQDETISNQVIFYPEIHEDMLQFKLTVAEGRLYTYKSPESLIPFSTAKLPQGKAIYAGIDPIEFSNNNSNNNNVHNKLENVIWIMVGEDKPGMHHTTLTKGQRIYFGGEIITDQQKGNEGKIISLNNNTGHYRTGLLSTLRAAKYFKQENLFTGNACINCKYTLPNDPKIYSIEDKSVDDFIEIAMKIIDEKNLEQQELIEIDNVNRSYQIHTISEYQPSENLNNNNINIANNDCVNKIANTLNKALDNIINTLSEYLTCMNNDLSFWESNYNITCEYANKLDAIICCLLDNNDLNVIQKNCNSASGDFKFHFQNISSALNTKSCQHIGYENIIKEINLKRFQHDIKSIAQNLSNLNEINKLLLAQEQTALAISVGFASLY